MKKITFFLFGLIALVACEAELETEHANGLGDTSRMTRSGLTISPEEAATQALEFRNSILEQSGQTRGVKDEKGVASVYAWRSSEISPTSMTRSTVSELLPDTLLYIVNFEQNSGYTLVSASKKLPGVVAYIEEGELTPDDEIDNPGFQEYLKKYAESYASIRDSNLPNGMGNISSIIPLEPVDTIGVLMDSIFPLHQYQMEEYIAPLLATKWGQYEPYNQACPIINPVWNMHASAGCVAIAVAQVAAFYNYPTSCKGHLYDWDAILQDSVVLESNVAGAASVAELVHDIGVMVNMHYAMESWTTISKIKHALDTLGYHNRFEWTIKNGILTPVEADFNSIKEDIVNRRPVIFSGEKEGSNSGHCWVIDGIAVKSMYEERIVIDENGLPRTITTKFTKKYVHCNWGMSGVYNGWFCYGSYMTMWDVNTGQEIETEWMHQILLGHFDLNNIAYYEVYPNP